METLLTSTKKSVETIITSAFDFKGTTKPPIVPAISAYRSDTGLHIVDDISATDRIVADSQIIIALEKVGIFDRKGAFLSSGQLSKNILLKNSATGAPVVKAQQPEVPDDNAIILRIIKENLDYSMLDKLLEDNPDIAKKLEKYYGYFITVTESTDLSKQLDKPISSIVAPRLIDEAGYLLEVVKLLPACVSEAGHTALKAHEEPLKVSKVFTDLGYTIYARTKKDSGAYQLALSKEVANGAEASAEKTALESLEGFTIRDITAPSIDSFTDKKKVIVTGEFTVTSK